MESIPNCAFDKSLLPSEIIKWFWNLIFLKETVASWQHFNIWITILCREGVMNFKLGYDNPLIVCNINRCMIICSLKYACVLEEFTKILGFPSMSPSLVLWNCHGYVLYMSHDTILESISTTAAVFCVRVDFFDDVCLHTSIIFCRKSNL